jgi:hypothetical protein
MILYNITFNIEPEIHQQWLDWMKRHYYTYVLGTDLFFDVKLFKLLNETENEGITYSVQFFTDTLDKAEVYLEKYASAIVARHNEAFRHKHVSFMTLLESVE